MQFLFWALLVALAFIVYLRWKSMWVRLRSDIAPTIRSWHVLERLQAAGVFICLFIHTSTRAHVQSLMLRPLTMYMRTFAHLPYSHPHT